MLDTNFVPLQREQFSMLREAKRLVTKEFSIELSLQDKNVLQRLYGFALESENERLFEIFNELYSAQKSTKAQDQDQTKKAAHSTTANNTRAQLDSIQVGDVVDGKRCTGFYRGQPVFKVV